MKIFTTLELEDLDRIADSMSIELYGTTDEGVRQRGKFAGRRCIRTTLRPRGDRWRMSRYDSYTKSGMRRIWAVSWAAHYTFMWALFTLDSGAVIKTGLRQRVDYRETEETVWNGQADFAERAFETRNLNIGSQIMPQSYVTAQSEGHFYWQTEIDLRDEATNVLEQSHGLIAS